MSANQKGKENPNKQCYKNTTKENKMDTEKWIAHGQKMGLTEEKLSAFVEKQQQLYKEEKDKEREERTKEREEKDDLSYLTLFIHKINGITRHCQ